MQASGGFSTISLAGILSNVANKTMLASFESVENVLGQIAGQADANDFKQVTSYRMTGKRPHRAASCARWNFLREPKGEVGSVRWLSVNA